MSATETAPKSFGIFGGGGIFGRTIFGNDGRFGRSGSGGIGGRRSSFGSEREAFGNLGKPSHGRLGSRIGLILNLNSGTLTTIASRISERSRTRFGHFGNIIIGRLGISIERSLIFQYWIL